MKKFMVAVMVVSGGLIVAYLVGIGGTEWAPEAWPAVKSASIAPTPRGRYHAPKPAPASVLPSELEGDAESIQVYLETKRELLSQQLGLARDYEDDLPEIKTAAQAQAELDRWSKENDAWRKWQAETGPALIENEAQLIRAIGEQKFAVLQGWEVARYVEAAR